MFEAGSPYRTVIGCGAWLLVPLLAPASGQTHAQIPQTIVWDGEHLHAVRQRMAEGHPREEEARALARLQTISQEALQHPPYSVTYKDRAPPSGDKHDYMSFSRYWWPDPVKPDGLPYIRRDGEVNRKLLAQGDRQPVGGMMDDVQALALAGYLLDDAECAAHACRLIKVWFLEPETRMNPHLKFGQAVPGRAEGRGVGIIDTRGFAWVLDAAELLDNKSGWTAADRQSLRAWFTEFLDWLLTSELGAEERGAENNHGSWYDVQVARYALFVGDVEEAERALQRARRRIDRQFDARGRQSAELKRTRSLHYSFFNLAALMTLARTGEHLDDRLWHYENRQGAGIQAGVDFLLPFAWGEQRWEYPTMGEFGLSRVAHINLRFASRAYDDPRYGQFAAEVRIRHGEQDFATLVSPFAPQK